MSNTINKKRTSNKELKRDTFIIFQLFLLILVILLVAKKLETFKTRKNKERFSGGSGKTYEDTVKITLSNGNELRLGYLDDIINQDNKIAYFNESLLIKPFLYDTDDYQPKQTNTKYDADLCESIVIKKGYSVILYEGSNFDNDKKSYLLYPKKQNKSSTTPINGDNFGDGKIEDGFPAIRSLKVFKSTDNEDIVKQEAHENNQILLFTKKMYEGHIIRLNLPESKNLKIKIPISLNNKLPYKSILLPGNSNISNPTYRNIKLSIFTDKGNEHEYLKSESDININKSADKITAYKVSPNIPTLDIASAETILTHNFNKLDSLQNKLKTVKQRNICKNSLIDTKQYEVVNKLSDNLIGKIMDQNNKYNYMISDYDL
jgi:hypothetical protein